MVGVDLATAPTILVNTVIQRIGRDYLAAAEGLGPLTGTSPLQPVTIPGVGDGGFIS